MESIRVRDLMIPVEKYSTIADTATLYDAVLQLEEAERDYEAGKCPHRALLVKGGSGEIIGKMGKIDVLRSLEPKYTELGELRKVSGFGLSAEFLKSVMEKFELWETPLDDLCRKAGALNVGAIVASPLEGETVDVGRDFEQGGSPDHSGASPVVAGDIRIQGSRHFTFGGRLRRNNKADKALQKSIIILKLENSGGFLL